MDAPSFSRMSAPHRLMPIIRQKHILILGVFILTSALSSFSSPTIGGEDSTPQANTSWEGSLDLAAGTNPTTLALLTEVRRRHIYHQDSSPLWDGLYTQLGGQLSMSPAFANLGLHAEWLPIAVMQLRLQYDRYHFFGRYGSLLRYDSGDEPFGDASIEARSGEEKSGNAQRLLFQPTLRLRFGPYLIRNKTDLALFDFSGPGPYYHEWEYDTLLKTQDRLVRNQSLLLYALQDDHQATILVGPEYEYLRTSHAKLTRKRLGLSGYLISKQTFSRFRQPRLWLQLGRYLEDRNREGGNYLLAGFGADFAIH